MSKSRVFICGLSLTLLAVVATTAQSVRDVPSPDGLPYQRSRTWLLPSVMPSDKNNNHAVRPGGTCQIIPETTAEYIMNQYAKSSPSAKIKLHPDTFSIWNDRSKKTGPVEFISQEDIERFDEDVLLPSESNTMKLSPFKWISAVRKDEYNPYYFPVHFNIYTRNSSLENVAFGPQSHRVQVCPQRDRSSCSGKSIEREYEFNLNQLSSIDLFNNPNKRTIILVPGFHSESNSPWVEDIKNNWLQFEDVNVIAVDWSLGNGGRYRVAVANYRVVSRQITMLLYYLAKVNGKDFESPEFRNNLYLVGHSLGAHITGWTGHELKGQVARVTGLDPAGPIFDAESEYNRLNPTNAKLVDAIHSNAGTIPNWLYRLGSMAGVYSLTTPDCELDFTIDDIPAICCSDVSLNTWAITPDIQSSFFGTYFGINFPVGHLDFYANGGSAQPGCREKFQPCAHGRATNIYSGAIAFEQQLNSMVERKSTQDMNRLYAFPAEDYSQFQSGQYFARACPKLVMLEGSDQSGLQALKRCAVPIDFVSRVDTLKKDLSQKYGIKFRSTIGEHESTEKPYFFETTAENPFVGEQILLKLHVNPNDEGQWQNGCQLKAAVRSPDSISYVVSPSKDMNLVEMNNFHGFAMPFASPVDWLKNHPSNRAATVRALLKAQKSLKAGLLEDGEINSRDNLPSTSVEKLRESLRRSLPTGVEIELSQDSSMFSRFVDSVKGIFGGKNSNKCQLNLSQIEVQLVDYGTSVSGQYSVNTDTTGKPKTLRLNLSDNSAVAKLSNIKVDSNGSRKNEQY